MYYSNCVFSVILLFVTLDLTNGQFGYSRDEQLRWQEEHRTCGGDLQSPIRIDSLKAIPIRMPALEMIRYHDLLPPLQVRNNGHSVSLTIAPPPPNQPDIGFIPYVFGARLANEYVLQEIHFHWGDKNNLGSEHTFNDVRFPMELHMVHRNRRYPTAEEAMNHTDGLTVLAFFYQLRENDNRPLNQLVRHIHHVSEPNATLLLNETFTLASMLPPTEDLERFYMYRGSLTTPPCSEAVTWILFPNPMPVSVAQMNRFRSLSSHDPFIRLANNFRHLQETGPRRIFVRKLRPRSTLNGLNGVNGVNGVNGINGIFDPFHHNNWNWLHR